MTSTRTPSSNLFLVANSRSNRSWHQEVTDAVTAAWTNDPRRTLTWLRDWLSEGLGVALELFRRAAAARADSSILDASCPSRLGIRLYTALCYSQSIWFDTDGPLYLERAEGPVILGEAGSPGNALVGTCYHDVAIAVLFGVQTAYRNCSGAGDFVEAMRARFGDDVEFRLSDLSARLNCESRSSLSRWGISAQEEARLVSSGGIDESADQPEAVREPERRQHMEAVAGDDTRESTDEPGVTDGGDEGAGANGKAGASRLSRCHEKAWHEYRWSVEQNPGWANPTDRQVYDWLKEKAGPDGDSLPDFDAWSRYVREARKAYGAQKNSSRAGRDLGRGVATPNQL